jgi:hypothetical protein
MTRHLSSSISHDALTRALKRAESGSQALLLRTARTLFGLKRGYLIIDDTVIEKAYAKCIEALAWVYSSKHDKQVLGLSIVVLCWSNGTIAVPLAFRLWRKGGATKTELGLELLRHAKQNLRLKPSYVLFDCYYASRDILKFLQRSRWKFVTRVKKNRLFNHVQVKRYKRNPYWRESGTIDGGLKVIIVRHGKKFFATNDTALAGLEIRELYKQRWAIEDAFRLLHDQLGLDRCQARSATAQCNHIRYCCLAYVAVVAESQRLSITSYQLKETLVLERKRYDFQSLRLKLKSA